MVLVSTKWQTIWNYVLPNSLPGILTGAILAISRARSAKTALLVVVGASTNITLRSGWPLLEIYCAADPNLPVHLLSAGCLPQYCGRGHYCAANFVIHDECQCGPAAQPV